MLYRATISAFASGVIRVGSTLALAEPLWIEPYTAVGVASPVTGGVDVYASFDGETYFVYAPGTVIEIGFLRTWKARIPARWLKFVGREVGGQAAIADGTLLEWGAKS
ncbi:MAG TPA: hypothetical protein PJ982_05520 [Lacipirellulaceae bacterium]|nr:hypothetical protein [Lacipirellulaceae bacterium]